MIVLSTQGLPDLNSMNFFLTQATWIFLLLWLTAILSKSLATNFLMFIYFLMLCKLLFMRNHFLNFLIILEVFMVVGYMTIMSEIYFLNSSLSFMFLFMVIMVMGACVGMSLLVVLTRLMNKELEVSMVSL